MIITKAIYNKIVYLYPKWKLLNEELKKIYPRGINLHEAFTEIICSYHLSLDLNIGSGTNSVDAINKDKKLIQIKGSSDCENDLSTFGPKTKFDILYSCCIQKYNHFLMDIYEIPIEKLNKVMVNKKETFYDQQKQGRRPRFFIYKYFIKPNNIKPLLTINLKNKI